MYKLILKELISDEIEFYRLKRLSLNFYIVNTCDGNQFHKVGIQILRI
jgi:hypothetical protein